MWVQQDALHAGGDGEDFKEDGSILESVKKTEPGNKILIIT